MHLLATQPGEISDGAQAVDLEQSPAEIVVLSAADTEIACLAAAHRARSATSGGGVAPSLRLASLLRLGHNLSVDLYVERVVRHARLVIVRLLGGRGYWPYGVDEIAHACQASGAKVAFLPGDDQPDAELDALTTLDRAAAHRLWQYCLQGGVANATNFLAYAATLLGRSAEWNEPAPLLKAGLYWPGRDDARLDAVRAQWRDGAPVAALIFYRALMQAANTAAIDALVDGLQALGLAPLPVYVTSLKDPVAAATVTRLLQQSAPPRIVLNTTGFAVSRPGEPAADSPFTAANCPILQVVFSGGSEDDWRTRTNGLSARDIAMNVALPEVDGRVLARAVSFKARARRDALTEADIVAYAPVADRIRFTAELAANWCRLQRTPVEARRVALVLANYPTRDGRIGNGVGLDTPASTMTVLRALHDAGYAVGDLPEDGDGLMRALAAGPTNASAADRIASEVLAGADYAEFFGALPDAVRRSVTDRWGAPEYDTMWLAARTGFAIPALRFGHVVVGVQPARGYHIDPVRSYHDPALVPPHGYFAFYAWLRRCFGIHAVVHMGKHGNLEWLPGKAVALSQACYPEAALGPLPHLYPFIVNDPGEGTQAKRRAQAVIIDHLTPPLTRAESYGPMRDLEALVDEYYEAANVDPRRLDWLRAAITEQLQATGIAIELGISTEATEPEAVAQLDTYLCELKEMQIRDGLHIFGQSPTGDQLTDLLVALVRVPRAEGKEDADSVLRALAADLGLAFDPLDCDLGAPWQGERPAVLASAVPWRTNGDTVERLEVLARTLVAGELAADPAWLRTRTVLTTLDAQIRPNVVACGGAEIAGLLAGLAGRFVAPGPSGAPTRGKPEVLPTGRNFYSVDTRTVPTRAAWALGWRSASLLVERYAQDHGEWPRAMALTAWGTSNMRTGGDDIAQALALLGVQPQWDPASRRVVGFEILPVAVLGRPRVDVTLRISGFFRDSFANLIDLFDSAVRAVADRTDESVDDNPLAHRVAAETESLRQNGMDAEEAARTARWRVFGSKPGAYGAGLQALIDERGWHDDADLARAYVAWGAFAYGNGADGAPARGPFERRLAAVQAVIQNQDNREHDVLDSDDYYQFEGGLRAAVRVASGAQPAAYHGDHSRPFAPAIRTLEDEIARVVRARVVNPKWIAGVMRHGYKGVSEMAATVDYLFAFAATAQCVHDHQFDMIYDAYVADEAVRAFAAEHNDAALAEMAARLMEAQDRGLWRPRSNSAYSKLQSLAGGGERV